MIPKLAIYYFLDGCFFWQDSTDGGKVESSELKKYKKKKKKKNKNKKTEKDKNNKKQKVVFCLLFCVSYIMCNQFVQSIYSQQL